MTSISQSGDGTAVDDAQVLWTVREIVAEQVELPFDEVRPDVSLVDLPGVDSLKVLKGLVAIEDRFGLTVDPDQAVVVSTVAEIAELVSQAIRDSQ
jgi:acyl carrier protein